MNRPTDQTRPTLSRPLTARIAAAIRDGLRSRQARASDDIVELDAHILKDIGAPSWLVSRAVERRDAQPGLTHVGAVRWLARLVTVAGIAVLAASLLGVPSARACKVSVPAPMEGVFTGELDRGVPVYRLPSISVSANRNVETARRSAQARGVDRARSLAQGTARAG
jgi:hypothetical protein